MNRRLKYALIFSAYATVAAAQVMPPQPSAPSTPDVTFAGAELDRIYNLLSVPDLYQRQPNGSMIPVINSGTQETMKIISERVKDRVNALAKEKTDKEAADKAKADAEKGSAPAPPAPEAPKPVPEK